MYPHVAITATAAVTGKYNFADTNSGVVAVNFARLKSTKAATAESDATQIGRYTPAAMTMVATVSVKAFLCFNSSQIPQTLIWPRPNSLPKHSHADAANSAASGKSRRNKVFLECGM